MATIRWIIVILAVATIVSDVAYIVAVFDNSGAGSIKLKEYGAVPGIDPSSIWEGEQLPKPDGYRSFLLIQFYAPGRVRTQRVVLNDDRFTNGDLSPYVIFWEQSPVNDYSYSRAAIGEILVTLQSRLLYDRERGTTDVIRSHERIPRTWRYRCNDGVMELYVAPADRVTAENRFVVRRVQ